METYTGGKYCVWVDLWGQGDGVDSRNPDTEVSGSAGFLLMTTTCSNYLQNRGCSFSVQPVLDSIGWGYGWDVCHPRKERNSGSEIAVTILSVVRVVPGARRRQNWVATMTNHSPGADQRRYNAALRTSCEVYLAKYFPDLRGLVSEASRPTIHEWIDALETLALIAEDRVAEIQEVVAVASHRGRAAQIEPLPTGGFTTSGATMSRICGAGLTVCPEHRRDKRRVVMASVAEALDRAEDEGRTQKLLVTVTFPKRGGDTWRVRAFLGTLRTGDKRRSGAARNRESAAKALRLVTAIFAPEDVMTRTKGTSAWQPWAHIHGVAAIAPDADPAEVRRWRQTIAGSEGEVHVKPITETAVRARKYSLKADCGLGTWTEPDTWMGVGRRVDVIARADAGEDIDQAVQYAAWTQFQRWLATGGAGSPYVPTARKSKPASTAHRAGLDPLYRRHNADDQHDTTTPHPTSTDTDADNTPIPTATRRPRPDIDDPLPPGYRRRSTLE